MGTKLSENGMIHAEDLYYLLGSDNNIKLLDATYAAPNGLSPYQAYLGQRIEGAQFFDIDTVADQSAPLPHTLPSAEYFASCVGAMGIGNNDHVVIYDQSGMYMASSRAWWMFRLFGHDNVYVLEGGLQAWVKKGYKIVNGPDEQPPEPATFTAKFRPELSITKEQLIANITDKKIDVLDARPAGRFTGQMQEPRPGMRAGHIPGSYNLPFGQLINRHSGFLNDTDSIERELQSLTLASSANIAVSCGSGVTACTVALALFKARGQNAAIYDGSWTEWGDEESSTPVEVSA